MPATDRAAIYLDKGGTGKTTCAAHLGVALERLGQDVLLLDLAGKQGDLADALGVLETVEDDIAAEDDFPNVATTMGSRWGDVADIMGTEAAVEQLVYETDSGPDLIPAHPDLDGLDADLGNIDDVHDRYTRLRGFLDVFIDPLDRWDTVLLDMPGMANNITYNGLWAAGDVVAPVAMGSFELKQAHSLVDDLETMRERYDQSIRLQLLIPNLYDRRTNLHSEMLERFEDAFGGTLGPEYIVDSQQIRTATERGQTLFDIPERDLLTTAEDARDAFLANAETLAARLHQ
jgi:chromosome partitioning protein